MNIRRQLLTAGCVLTMLCVPMTAYANPVQVSPREELPVMMVTNDSFSNVAISRVTNYVNVRAEANTSSAIVGKIYNNCAATIEATVDGEGGKWYQIKSGNVTGYIKASYFITGSEAEKIAKEIGTVFVSINTTTLRLREQPNTESTILTLLSRDAEYIEVAEEGDFVKIQVDESLSGYVHKDYVIERVEFDCAVTLEEEAQQKAEEERLKKEAEEAIAALTQLQANAGTIAPQGNSGTGADASAPAQDTSAGAGAPTSEPIGIIAANPNGTTHQVTQPSAQAPAADSSASENQAGGANESGNAGNVAIAPNGAGSQSGPTAGGQASGSTDSGAGQASGSQSGPAMTGGTSSSNVAQGPGAVNLESVVNGGTQNAQITSAARTAIVAYAKQFLGNPYVYGGTSLTDGADCSGFTMRIFEHFGIDTGRTSRDQAAKGKTIPIESIQPGDLLFYASGDYINHVALYIGNGQIIHASTSKTGIITSTAYYRTPYKAVTFLN